MTNLTNAMVTIVALVAPTLSFADINNHAVPVTATSGSLNEKIAEATELFNTLYGDDAAILVDTIADKAKTDSQIIWDQHSGSPWAQKGIDIADTIDNFQYQVSATQHRIRLRDANNNPLLTSFSAVSRTDTQALILNLTRQTFNSGFEMGFESGYTDGYTLGYQDGYEDGYSDAENNDG